MKIPQQPPNPNTPSADLATQHWVSTHYGSKDSSALQDFNGILRTPALYQRFNVKYYGAKGDGTTDDTNAIQAAVNDWIAATYATTETAAVLYFPPGDYVHTSPLSLTFTANSSLTKLISGYGARLKPNFASGHALDITVTSGVTRNLTIEGLMIYGGNLSDTTKALLHLGGGTSPAALYRCSVREVALEGFSGDGVLIDGFSFEHAFVDCHIDTSNTVGVGIHVFNAAGGGGSSIDIYGGTISGGLHNVYGVSPQGGVKIFGGTYLNAYSTAIHMDGSTEGAVFGAHIENAQQGGTASPGWTTGQAGIYMAGRATIVGVSGNCGNSKMRYVARIFASPSATIQGGAIISGCDYYVRADGAASSTLTLLGCPKGATGVVDNGMPSTSRIVEVGVEGGVPVLLAIGSGLSAGTYVGTGTPEAAVSAGPGSIYQRVDGVSGTCIYVKASGIGNTGWKTIQDAGAVSTQTPGAVTTVTIAHGLGAIPTRYNVNPANANARGASAFYLTADATNITLNFASSLTAATSYSWVWTAGF